jgi:hypothetical protein
MVRTAQPLSRPTGDGGAARRCARAARPRGWQLAQTLADQDEGTWQVIAPDGTTAGPVRRSYKGARTWTAFAGDPGSRTYAPVPLDPAPGKQGGAVTSAPGTPPPLPSRSSAVPTSMNPPRQAAKSTPSRLRSQQRDHDEGERPDEAHRRRSQGLHRRRPQNPDRCRTRTAAVISTKRPRVTQAQRSLLIRSSTPPSQADRFNAEVSRPLSWRQAGADRLAPGRGASRVHACRALSGSLPRLCLPGPAWTSATPQPGDPLSA